jgi:hypothetical protein
VVRKGYGMLQAYLAKQVEVRYPRLSATLLLVPCSCHMWRFW